MCQTSSRFECRIPVCRAATVIDWKWLSILMLACSGCGYAVGWMHHEAMIDTRNSTPIIEGRE